MLNKGYKSPISLDNLHNASVDSLRVEKIMLSKLLKNTASAALISHYEEMISIINAELSERDAIDIAWGKSSPDDGWG